MSVAEGWRLAPTVGAAGTPAHSRTDPATDQAAGLRAMVAAGAAGAAGSPAPARTARFVAISSGKGGVGKTSLSVNLAVRLAAMKRRVVLIDADLGTANADLLCGVAMRVNLAHVIAGERRIEEAIIDAPGGFRLVPGASALASAAALSRGDRHRLVDELARLNDVADIVLIDTGAGIGPAVLSFGDAADELLLVVTPEPTSMTDGYALIKSAWRHRPDLRVRLVVNMVRDRAEAEQVFGRLSAVAERFLALPLGLAGFLPIDTRVSEAVHVRQPFVLAHPQCDAARSVTQIAHRLDRHVEESPASDGWLTRLRRWWKI